jgi:hypothetical protein
VDKEMNRILDIPAIKQSQRYTHPWEHKIIDNFFPDDVYQQIRQLGIQMSEQVVQEEKTYPMWMNEVLRRGGDPDVVDKIIDAADDVLDNINYLLEEFSQTQFSSQGYFAMPKFGISGKDFKYPIHTESSHKVILFVVYIYPEVDVGTKLYTENNEDSFVKAVEWKENRAFMTVIDPHNKTWHNWSGNQNPSRITLNIFCEKMEELENSIMHSGIVEGDDDLNDLLWIYEQFAKGRLTSLKG